jgi:hypothetical protein
MRDPAKRPVMVHLDPEDFDRLTELCERNGVTRADFLRSAIEVADTIPLLQTRPLTGVCLERHVAKEVKDLVEEIAAVRKRKTRK